MTGLLVLHRYGDAAAGRPWRAALETGIWPGEWEAPDLQGHGNAPWVADCYEQTDLVIEPLRRLIELGWPSPPVVVGVAEQCTAAKVLALGGRAAGIVLVDEFPGPWPVDTQESIDAEYAWLRELADDSAAVAPAPAGRPDPRTAHGLTPRADRAYAAAQREAITVPVLDLPGGSPAHVVHEAARWWATEGSLLADEQR